MAGPGSGVDGRTRPGFKWKSARNTAPSGSDAAKPVQQPAQESAAEEAEMPHLPPTEAPEIPVQAAFANGEMVEIIGLQGALDLNGRVGIVREFDPASRRHRVELLEEDGSVRQVRVRPANLDLLSAEEFMPSCASKKKPPTVSKDPATLRPSQPVRTSHEEPEMAVALANAVNQCDLFQVQALLRDRADPNGHSQSPGTPLLLEAAAKTAAQSLDLAALLLGYNADPDAVLDRCRSAKAVRSEKEVETLCQIFRSKSASTEEERTILSKLDAGALAQARRLLKLSGPFALGGIAPAVCLEESSSCQELEATKAHRLFLHSADGLRPVLVMRPSAGQPSALVVLLHGLFQSARMLETTVRRLSDSVPHMLFVMPTAPTRDGWSVGPAWFDHTRSARKAEALEECRSEILALLSSQGHEWGITPERVVLAGFSMGGTLAAWTALQVPRPLAGLLLFGTEGLSFTGGWAAPKTLDGPGSDWAVGAESLQVLQCHGREDTLCPIGSATTCADELRRLGCSVRALAFQGVGHALSTDMVDEAKLWLQKQLPALET